MVSMHVQFFQTAKRRVVQQENLERENKYTTGNIVMCAGFFF